MASQAPMDTPIAPALTYYNLGAINIANCYGRVSATPTRMKNTIETEEASIRALNMDDNGAKHYLEAGRLPEYLLRNPDQFANDIVLVCPSLRNMINAVVAANALTVNRYEIDADVKVELVHGTEGYRQLKNMDEYRVGFFAGRDIAIISAAMFYGDIWKMSSNISRNIPSSINVGLVENNYVFMFQIEITKKDPFFSTEWQDYVWNRLDQPAFCKTEAAPNSNSVVRVTRYDSLAWGEKSGVQ